MIDISCVTKKVKEYVNQTGISISHISRETKIPYSALYASLGEASVRERDLRDAELIEICRFLKVNPMDFADTPKKRSLVKTNDPVH